MIASIFARICSGVDQIRDKWGPKGKDDFKILVKGRDNIAIKRKEIIHSRGATRHNGETNRRTDRARVMAVVTGMEMILGTVALEGILDHKGRPGDQAVDKVVVITPLEIAEISHAS